MTGDKRSLHDLPHEPEAALEALKRRLQQPDRIAEPPSPASPAHRTRSRSEIGTVPRRGPEAPLSDARGAEDPHVAPDRSAPRGRRGLIVVVVLAAVAGAGVGGWGWLAQHPSAVEPPLAPAPTAAADSALPTPAVDPPIVATEDLASLAVPPATDSSGRVIVRADTVGARVWIDNVYRGRTPLTVADLPAGRHVVTVEGPAGRVRRVVEVKAGSTAPLLVPTSAAEPGAVAVTAPAEVEVREGGRVLGSSRAERILLDPGTHTLELVNEAIGYESRRVVEIVPGRTTSIALTFPDGALSLNALPWAEVFVDGRRIGETPIGNLKVAVGPHQVTFRHPELGEVTRSVDVTLRGPTRVSVNLERKER